MRLPARGDSNQVVELLSRSPEETHRLGIELASILPVPGVLLLRGSLGTGKTTLARGVAEGLGLQDTTLVNSPSFTLVNTYYGRCPIYHVDLYRLSGDRDLRSIGLEEFLGRDGVTIVEWGERLGEAVASALEVTLEDGGEDKRRIRVHYLPANDRFNTGHKRNRKRVRESRANNRTGGRSKRI